MCEWAKNVQRFLLDNFDTIYDSPSHIYHSALPLCPSSLLLQKHYSTELLNEVKVVKGLPARWGASSRTVSFDKSPSTISCLNTTIAVGFTSGDIIILNAITGRQEASLSGHTAQIRTISFSPDGASLASGGNDKTLNLWDLQTGGISKLFSGHGSWIESLSISADNIWIASGCWDKKIYLWNVQTGECHCTIEQQAKVDHISFSHTDPQCLISISGNKIRHWDIDGYQIGPSLHGAYINFSLDGAQLALWEKPDVIVQDFESNQVAARFHLAAGEFRYCCFSPDGRLFATAVSNTAYVWDISSSGSSPIETFTGHSDHIVTLAFISPSSLISASKDRSLKFWQIGTSSISPVETHPKLMPYVVDKVLSLTLQAKEDIIITSDSDGVVKIWDISTGCCKESFQTLAGDNLERDIQLIGDKLIFTWHANRCIYIWDIKQGKLLLAVDAPWPGFKDVKISGDGSKIFGLDYVHLQAWSIWTGEVLSKMEVRQFLYPESLTVDGSRVWVHDYKSNCMGWDFKDSNSSPLYLPSTPSSKLHPKGSLLYDTQLSRVWDIAGASKKVIFQLATGFGKPADVQWNDQHLVMCFKSGEVLILNFSHMFL